MSKYPIYPVDVPVYDEQLEEDFYYDPYDAEDEYPKREEEGLDTWQDEE